MKNNENTIQPQTQNKNQSYIDYTDNLIENLFTSNTLGSIDSPSFFDNITYQLQQTQSTLQSEINTMLKDDKINTQKIKEKKIEYLSKLDTIKSTHHDFETKVDSLNDLYSDKLSYIALLSKNLFEFEKFKQNIKFTNKIFSYINDLNKSSDTTNITIPSIFSDKELVLTEGIEIYLSLKQLIDSSATNSHYANFVANFSQIELTMKQTINESIKSYYSDSNWEKLQTILQITDIMNSDMIISLYTSFIIDDIYKLNELITRIMNVNVNGDNVSDEQLQPAFQLCDEFHNSILKLASEQFGSDYSRVYLLFPENKQRSIVGVLVNEISKRMNSFRQGFLNEINKTDKTYVKMFKYIYPKTILFYDEYKVILEYIGSEDIILSVEQETKMFLRCIESVYMYKERNMIGMLMEEAFPEEKEDNKIKKTKIK